MTWSQDFGSGKGERPVGVPAAHGHWGDGGADIRGALESPEHDSVCRWGVGASMGRSDYLGSVRKYSKVGSWEFRWSAGWKKSKDFTQSTQRNCGEKSENGNGVNRREAEGAEKGKGESATRLTFWQAGAQQAAPLPSISGGALTSTDRCWHSRGMQVARGCWD